MNGMYTLYIDQWGGRYYASTVKELRQQIGMGGCRVSKLYRDKRDGRTVHCGYIIGHCWLTAYQPVELPA
jgi:hypothetical protein